jgi:hypothetical protein
MTDETTEDGDGNGVINLEPGTQAVAKVPAMEDPLCHLPPEAFDDLLLICTRGDPSAVEEVVLGSGADPSRVLVVPVTGTSLRYDGPLRVAERTAPSDMTKVGVNFAEGLSEIDDEGGWVFVNNFNVFLMYADENTVYRFMNSLTNETRQAGARGVYCTVRDAIGDTTYEKFRQLCDTEIDLR